MNFKYMKIKIKKIEKIALKKIKKFNMAVIKAKRKARRINKTIQKAIKSRAVYKLFKQLAYKAVVLLLIAGLNWAGLSAIGQTFAYFNDGEILGGNTYSMGSLNFSLEGNGIEEYNFGLGDATTTVITITDYSSLDLKYTVSASTAGDLCDDLDLIAKLNNIEQHNGALINFTGSAATTTMGEWEFTVNLPVESSDVGVCEFDFVFQGWQEEVGSYQDGGFVDEERISNIISGDVPTPEEENLKPVPLLEPADHVVINEVYGGGGNNSSYWKNDFIELYNASSSPISLDGWSAQYASKQGEFTTGRMTILSGMIPAHGFYLIQEHSGGSGAQISLPAPDTSDNINLSFKEGKIALVNNTEAITGKGDPDVVDFVGYGDANEYEGSKAAPELSDIDSIERGLTGYDSDNNSIDFIIKNNPTPTNSNNEGMPDILINEFLASTTPSSIYQEFVEIYNASTTSISLDGWRIEVENDGVGSTTDLTGFVICINGWLAVEYEDKNVLRASSTITIYDDNNNEIDKIFYINADIADKSFARIPDGSANWVDPTPTPMGTNVTEENLEFAGLSWEDLEIDLENNYSVKKTADDVAVGGGAPSSAGSSGFAQIAGQSDDCMDEYNNDEDDNIADGAGDINDGDVADADAADDGDDSSADDADGADADADAVGDSVVEDDAADGGVEGDDVADADGADDITDDTTDITDTIDDTGDIVDVVDGADTTAGDESEASADVEDSTEAEDAIEPEPEPEPEAKLEPEPAPEPTPEPESAPEPEPEPEAKPEPEPAPEPEPDADSEPEPKPDTETNQD